MSVSPTNPIDISVLCACGEPIAHHKCPSSQGYAPRAPKTDVCGACGLKAHQNLEKTTVMLECLYRQWAQSRGLLTRKGSRLLLPPVTADHLTDLAAWLSNPQASALDASGNLAVPDTTATLKRMAARAASAPPQPTPPAAPTTVPTVVPQSASPVGDACVICGNPLHGQPYLPGVCSRACANDAERRVRAAYLDDATADDLDATADDLDILNEDDDLDTLITSGAPSRPFPTVAAVGADDDFSDLL